MSFGLTRLGAHDRGSLSLQRFPCHFRLLTVVKKKRVPPGLGRHSNKDSEKKIVVLRLHKTPVATKTTKKTKSPLFLRKII